MFKLIRRAISFLLALIIIVPGYALFATWKAANYPATNLSAAAIVIPGAAQLNGEPGEVLLARLQEAKRLYEDGAAPLVITVGAGAPGDRTTEAAAGRYWLTQNGLPKSAVVAIATGRDTRRQTQAYVRELQSRDLSSVIIATDPYHCRRSATMAEDLDIKATCSPVQSGPNNLANSRSRYLIREAGAYLSYITLGRRGIHISDHLNNGAITLGAILVR